MSEGIVTRTRGTIFEIVLNRPEKRNALSNALLRELDQAVMLATRSSGVRCVLLRGEGKCFSSGIDVTSFMELKDIYGEHWIQRGRMITADIQQILNRLERLEIPTIALLHGFCLGLGLELALACDIRIASVDLKLGLPETLLGLIPDVGGTTRLTRLIGPARAKELIFTGRTIDATTAERYGLLNKVVPSTELLPAAEALATEISRAAPLAVGMAKRVIDGLADNERGFSLEGWAQSQLFGTEDFMHAIKCFATKEVPVFKGS